MLMLALRQPIWRGRLPSTFGLLIFGKLLELQLVLELELKLGKGFGEELLELGQ